MVRISTLGLIRLLLRTASFRACYALLGEAEATALRAEVASPDGFAGLRCAATGYASELALVEAARADGWVLDAAALERPLFPAVDEGSGRFLFSETFEVERLCPRLLEAGRGLGMHRHRVGAWSFRKDACERPAHAGYGVVAARVLGHRSVNSRTMDRVYRSDLRTRDLGAFWMKRPALELTAPLRSLSATRVERLGGVRGMDDVPSDAPERVSMYGTPRWVEARAQLDAARGRVAAILEGGSSKRLTGGWRVRLTQHGEEGEAAAADVDKAELAVGTARDMASKDALDAYRRRVYDEGKEALRVSPELQAVALSTHAWAARSEDAAIAFGLDRRDRTGALHALRLLPPALQGSIIQVGALHVLPDELKYVGRRAGGRRARWQGGHHVGPAEEAYGRVRERCEADGICSLWCRGAACAAAPREVDWPETAREFKAWRCERCDGAELGLSWAMEGMAAAAGLEAAGGCCVVGAAAALGPSFVESYGVWRRLGARAAIGNRAWDAGCAVTMEAEESERVALAAAAAEEARAAAWATESFEVAAAAALAAARELAAVREREEREEAARAAAPRRGQKRAAAWVAEEALLLEYEALQSDPGVLNSEEAMLRAAHARGEPLVRRTLYNKLARARERRESQE